MADFAAPLPNAGALPVWKPTDESDQLSREIQGFVKTDIQPRFDVLKGNKEELGGKMLKDHVNEMLFPIINTKFGVDTRYVVTNFQSVLYSMLNNASNYRTNKSQAIIEPESQRPTLTPEPVPKFKRERTVNALDTYKKDDEQNTRLNMQAAADLAGTEVSRGTKMVLFNKLAAEEFGHASEEVRQKMESEAERLNAEKEEWKKISDGKMAAHVAKNQSTFSETMLKALGDVTGMGPAKVGQAVFHVSGAYKDSTGKVHTVSGVVGEYNRPSKLTSFDAPPAEKRRFMEWAKTNLFTLVEHDETGRVWLPHTDVSRLIAREIISMLKVCFAVPAGHGIMIPIHPVEQLRAYYLYVVECQEKDAEPVKQFVATNVAAGAKADDSAEPDGDRQNEGVKANEGTKPDESVKSDGGAPSTPVRPDFSSGLVPPLPPPSPLSSIDSDMASPGGSSSAGRGRGGRPRGGGRGRGGRGPAATSTSSPAPSLASEEVVPAPMRKRAKRKEPATASDDVEPAAKKAKVAAEVEVPRRTLRSNAPAPPPAATPAPVYQKKGVKGYVYTPSPPSSPNEAK